MPHLAVILAVPAFFAVAFPLELIASTDGFEEVHFTLLVLTPEPVTLNVVVLFTFIEAFFFENLIEAFLTVIFLLSWNVSPLAVISAVILALPAFFALTLPDWSTEAMLLSDELYDTVYPTLVLMLSFEVFALSPPA